MKLNKKYKVYLMHHSHTDIGYTKSPESTINEQVEYIKTIIRKLDPSNNQETNGFKWVCESFIIVESFLKTATTDEIELFIDLVKDGQIEVTGMYANLAEVLDAYILDRMIKRAVNASEKYNIDVTSAMNADINGLSKDYAKMLSKNGIHNYYIAVHTHHGMYPLFKKQSCFKWNLGEGEYLNVWNGEHYMFGNGFAFSKGAVSLHGFFDNVDFKKYNQANDESWMELAESRFEKYIAQLEVDGYGYDFIPLTIHGKFTDNSMPNFDIANRVKRWNEKNGDQIEVVMCNLTEFFEVANKEANIPVYTGEWPDWWTDGVISAPAQLKLFKNAQVQYNKLRELAKDSDDYTLCYEQIDHNLTMYAEHTYGSYDSITNPYHDFTHRQWALKQNYLSNALREIDKLEHQVLKTLGRDTTNHNVPTKFKVINSASHQVNQVVELPFGNSDADSLSGNYQITDKDGNNYSYVTTADWRMFPIVDLNLEANQEKVLNVQSLPMSGAEEHPYFSRKNFRGSDNVFDLNNQDTVFTYRDNSIFNESLKLAWDKSGINSITNNGVDLLEGTNGFLNVIYELSKEKRDTLGRNRKGNDVQRDCGQLLETKVIERNAIFTQLKQSYKVAGFNEYTLFIKLFNRNKYIEFKLQCEKQIAADVENVYLALPFKNKDVTIGKSQSEMKVWDEQLPGTLTDYYATFEGLTIGDEAILTTPDSHLIQVGSLENQDRVLFGDEALESLEKNYYVWLMSNYWETNFVKSLAGFYEFNYTLYLEPNSKTLNQVADTLTIFPVFEELDENIK